jgi:hypothetical protein
MSISIKKSINSLIRFTGVIITAYSCAIYANIDVTDRNEILTKKLNGPRLGLTYVAQSDILDGNGDMKKSLRDNGIGDIISLFGWHFEWLVTPEDGGPSFITEVIPFIGGVEHSTLIPSATVALGVRLPNGLEFGMGPNLLLRIHNEKPKLDNSLLIAVGKSIDFNSVSIPLNLAVTTNKTGTRFSFVFGYAMVER